MMPRETLNIRKLKASLERLEYTNQLYTELIGRNNLMIENRKKQIENLNGCYRFTMIGFNSNRYKNGSKQIKGL
jgi:hypothetical protein